MSRHYTAALVGLGRIAWRFDADVSGGAALTHWGSYRRDPRTKVIGGCSPSAQDRLDFQKATGIEACETIDQLLCRHPDIVSICSPSEAHFEQVHQCLEAEIPMVWLEKPPTLKLGDLETLMGHRSYTSGKTRVLVNYMRRYSKLYRQLSSAFRENRLGRPVAMQILYSRGLELNASHFLDLTFSMLGDSAQYQLAIGSAERSKPNPTFVLGFDKGFLATFCGHDTDYHINDVVLVFENGRASVLSGGMEVRWEEKAQNERYAGFYRLRQSASPVLQGVDVDDSFSVALSDLLAAHETGRDPTSNLGTARPTQKVIDEVRRV